MINGYIVKIQSCVNISDRVNLNLDIQIVQRIRSEVIS